MKIIFTLSLSALLLLSRQTEAQNWDLIPPRTEGLGTFPILGIEKGDAMWLTFVLHPHGISRYNGLWEYSSDTFGADNDLACNFDICNRVLYFDPDGSGLWIGRSLGVYFVSAKSLASSSPQAENKSRQFFGENVRPNVTAIYRDHDLNLWIATENAGIVRQSPGGNLLKLDTSMVATSIVETRHEGASLYWFGTLEGLYQFDGNGKFVQKLFPGVEYYGLLGDRVGRLWAATNRGLFVAPVPYSANFILLSEVPNCRGGNTRLTESRDVIQDDYGTVWSATANSVYRFWPDAEVAAEQWKVDAFPCNNAWPGALQEIRKMTVDASGFVWVASREQGLLRYNTLWEHLQPTVLGARSDKVNVLYRSPKDSILYVGTDNGALYRTRDNWDPIDFADICSSSSQIYSFLHDPDTDFVFIGNSCLTDPCKLNIWVPPQVFSIRCQSATGCLRGIEYRAIVKFPNDTLWLAGGATLLSTRIDGLTGRKQFNCINDTALVDATGFNALLLQDSSYVWIGTSGAGLARYDLSRRTFTHWAAVGGFKSATVLSLHFDNTGTLWIGTDQGLTSIASGFDPVRPNWRDITNEGSVNFVFSSSTGEIWFDAPEGVAHYSPDAGITKFPPSDKGGPLSQNVNTGLALLENQRESFWFGTDNGISIFHGDSIPPQTRITRPTIEDQDFTFIAPSTILISSNSLEVTYLGGDNFTPSSDLTFRSVLTQNPAAELTGPFTNVTTARITIPVSGTYHFFVQARDQSGNFDRTPACLTIIADLDAPSVVISQPLAVRGQRAWVRDTLTVQGSVIDADLDSFTVEIIDPDTGERLLPAQTGRGTKRAEVLAKFPVRRFDDKMLRVQVKAVDLLAHTRLDTVTVRVDAAAPGFQILTPETGAQFENTFDARLRFIEQHLARLEYFELGAENPIPAKLEDIQDDAATPEDANDRLIWIRDILLGPASGKQAFVFQMSDSAGNITRDTLTVARISSAANNMSRIYFSQDGLVEVHLPPGRASLTLRISPLDDEEYFDKARAKRLEPKSRAYLLEPPEAFGRRATLSFKIIDTTAAANASAIFRYEEENSSWTRMGGQSDTRDEHPWLRTQIAGGGVYLMAQSQDEIGGLAVAQEGNVTCLPRMFSPARGTISEFTDVVFSLKGPSPVTIHVFNTAGRQVKALVENESMTPGRHAVRWNGRDNGNDPLRSGIYIVVVKTDAFTETKTVVIQN